MTDSKVVVIVGGGPRGVGVLERIAENLRRDGTDAPVTVHIVDPYPIGPGRIWRYDQSAELRLNSLASDVSLFTDETSTIDGPVTPGPSVVEWAEAVRSGELDVPILDDAVRDEIEQLRPTSFPTRRLQSHYLSWFARRVAERAPASLAIVEHRGWVESVTDQPSDATAALRIVIREESGDIQHLDADAVVYALGHVDAHIQPRHAAIAARADELGLRYVPPGYAADVDLSAITADDTVLLRGTGLSFIDLVVRLTVDRGGRYRFDPDQPLGQRVQYVPSGREPHLITGSRRGVPYHAKTTSRLQGENHGFATDYFTHDWLRGQLDDGHDVDLVDDIWPVAQQELAHSYYRELFTGHPDRVDGEWEELHALFEDGERFDGAVIDDWLREHVAVDDRLDFDRLLYPLQGVREPDSPRLQQRLREYILDDLERHESDRHSEQTAFVQTIIGIAFVLGEVRDHSAWNARTRASLFTDFWHSLFSYIASGPPGERLDLLLTLVDQGVLEFLGSIDDVELTADGYRAHSVTLDDTRSADVLVEAYQPRCSVSATRNPALGDLYTTGQGHERIYRAAGQELSNGKLAIERATLRVVSDDEVPSEYRWAAGEFTDGGQAAAFARPRTNAASFRLNDRLARDVLNRIGALQPADGPRIDTGADVVDIGPAAIGSDAAKAAVAATSAG